jgi:hypothetical protein
MRAFLSLLLLRYANTDSKALVHILTHMANPGAPLLRSGGPPYTLGLSASVPPAARAFGRGQAVLRSSARSSPAWRWA